MIQAGQGTIINVSSMAGKRGWANPSAYCASKFALTGFTQALGAETRPHGVRACVVYPGATATHWGCLVRRGPTWGKPARRVHARRCPPGTVAAFIAWIGTAPAELVLDEAIVTPLDEARISVVLSSDGRSDGSSRRGSA